MNISRFIKIIFIFLLLTSFQDVVKGQQDPMRIEVKMWLNSFQTAPGMPDAENNLSGPIVAKPDLYYFVKPLKIEMKKGNNNAYDLIAQSDEFSKFYVNEYSETKQVEIHPLIWETITDSEMNWFNLSDPGALKIQGMVQANEDDLPFQAAYAGDDDFGYYMNFWGYGYSSFARTGNHLATKTMTIGGSIVPYPYYFKFSSQYFLDALEPDLRYVNSAGNNQTTFCEGETMYVKADYKGKFYNGTFVWERNDGGVWYTVTSNGGAVLPVTVDFSLTNSKFRARLKATEWTYGVNDFGSNTCVATIDLAPQVLHQLDDISVDVRNKCENELGGNILPSNLSGAIAGNQYIITLSEPSANGYTQIDSEVITCSTSDCPEINNVSFFQPVGKYKVGVFSNNSSGTLACGRTKIVHIKDSPQPSFSVTKSDVVCHGGNGKIFFNAIKTLHENTSSIMRAINLAGDTISNTINGNGRYGSLVVPVGKYILSVENDDNCIYEHPDTVEIFQFEELIADVEDLNSYEVNGVTYHGICASDRFSATINITGGASPYSIYVNFPSNLNIANRWFHLLENDTTITLPNLQEGTYYFTIKDRVGCQLNPIAFTINNPSAITFPSLNVTDPTVSCGGVLNDGAITQLNNPTGGFSPYELYDEENQVSNFDMTGLGNSTHNLKVVDSVGCENNQTVNVINNSFLRVEDNGEVPELVPCVGSTVYEVTVTGGMVDLLAGYDITLNGINCDDNPNCVTYTTIFNEPATYYITVSDTLPQTFVATDDTGCSVSIVHQFKKPDLPQVSGVSAVPPACSGGIYTATFFIENLSAGFFATYADFSYELDGNLVAGQLDTDGSFPIEPPQMTIPVSGDGLHQIKIIDQYGCESSVPYEFNLQPISTFDFTLVDKSDIACSYDSTGTITFSLNGDAPYEVEIFKDTIRIDSISITDDEYLLGNLNDGTYSFEITDSKKCSLSSGNIIITQPNPLQAMVATTNTINCSGENGEIVVSNVSGGTAPYTYSFNGSVPQTSLTYDKGFSENTITVIDANNCVLELGLSIPLAGPTIFPTLTPYLPEADCEAGAATVEVQAGYTFPLTIKEIASPQSFIPVELNSFGDSIVMTNYIDTIRELSAGKHYFVFTDGLGCETLDSITIGTATPLTASITNKVEESCYQQSNDGSITITVSGGAPPYSIIENEGTPVMTNDFYTFPNLTDGLYTYSVMDSRGCFFSLADSIQAGKLPRLNSIISDYVGCVGEDLSATVTLSGFNGTAPYSFVWNDGNTDNPRSGLIPAEYNITITDGNGCVNQDITIVPNLDTLNISIKNITDVVCQADSTGQITVTAKGAFSPYQFSIDGGNNFQTDSIFTGLPIGDYEIIVKDIHDCLDTISATVTFTNPLVATVTTTNESCKNSNDGTLEITVGGGIAPFSYSIDNVNFQAQNIFTGLVAGTYSAWVMDGSGCRAVYHNNIITEPSILVLTTALIANETCNQMNGGAFGSASGGTLPYVYEWDGDVNLNNSFLENVAAGLHMLKVTDANGCVETSSITIGFEAAPELTLENSQSEICGNSNGLIDLKITNGTTPFTFQWSHDGSLNDSIAVNLAAGNYSVTITDANACTDILSISIDEIEGPTLSLETSQSEICGNSNGLIDLKITNGIAPFGFQWSHDGSLNDSIATNLTAGNYSVTISDANACTDILNISIDEIVGPTLSLFSKTNTICTDDNGEIVLENANGSAPFTYTWSHDATLNNNTATNLSGGNYSITITDANGCSDILSNVIIDFSPSPVLSIASFNNTDCLNPQGDITVQTTGGTAPLTYEWSHDSNLTGTYASNLSSGTYTITVTDANNCKSIVTQSLIEFEGDISITNSLECFGDSDGSLLVTLQGDPNDYDYEWSDPTIPNFHIATNLSSETYTVTVTNSNGCSQDFSIELNSPAEISPNISNVIPVGCGGNLGSATVSPTGGTGNYIYNWNDPNGQTTPTASNLPTGNYTVLIIDGNGCTTFENVEIVQSSEIILTPGTITNPLCQGEENGSVEVVASQGFPPYNYLWSGGQTTSIASNLAAGDYTVTITDAVGCTQSMMTTIDEPMALNADAILIQAPLCFAGNEGEVSVSGSGGTAPFQYQWDDNNSQNTATASNLIAGVYQVTITDLNGCSTIAEVEVSQPTVLEITNSILQKPSCVGLEDGSIEVVVEGGTPNYQYNWNGGGASNNNTFTNIEDGIYSLEIIDQNGCSILENIELEDPDSILLVNEILTPVSCEGTPNGEIEILAEGGDQNLSYNWANGMSDNFLENLPVGSYEVSITDGLGCELITSFEIESVDVAPLDLGQADTLICNNGVLYYDFSNTDYIEFSWGSVSEGVLSNAAEFTTIGEDIYYLQAVRDDGCVVEDSIQVRFTEGNLDAFFIAPTDIVVGDTIVALELTLPIPTSVEWVYDDASVELVEQRDNQYLFYFSEVGEFDLKMISTLGGCQSDISKNIFVYADSTEIPFVNATVPTITELKLFPNPNDGNFTINVELANIDDMVIDIYNDESMLVNRNIFTGKDIYSKNYQLDLPTGIYYVIVQVAGVRRSLTFVID